MNTAYVPTFLAAAISWDPITMVTQMGILARLILLSLVSMACWVCWSAVAKRDAQGVRSRVRYLRAIGQTAPMVGFLGTAIGAINALTALAAMPAPSWSQFSEGMSEALVTAAIGLVVGLAAYWTAAVLNGDEVVVHHK